MNRETRILSKKLTALFLSIAMIFGLCPMNSVDAANGITGFELVDYQEVYYNGFNSDIAMAAGTCIELVGAGVPIYVNVDEELAKEEGAYLDYGIDSLVDGNAHIYYSEGKVNIEVTEDDETIYEAELYTPRYVDLSEMPSISLNEEIPVEAFAGKTTEQFYRIDKSTLKGETRAYTLALDWDDDEYYDEDDEDDEDYFYDDTFMTLYNQNKVVLDENDDADEGTEDTDSAIVFDPSAGSYADAEYIVIGVRNDEYMPFTRVALKLVSNAKKITSFEVENIDDVNTFYEGFNDDLLYATGTKIRVTLDNGETRTWVAEDYSSEYDEEGGYSLIEIDEVEAMIYRGNDGSIYVKYWLSYLPENIKTAKLFTPVIKPIDEIPLLEVGATEGTTSTVAGQPKYYRIAAGDNKELWSLTFHYPGENEGEYEGYCVEVYEANGTMLNYYDQPYDEDTDELFDLDVDVEVPAKETRIIAIYDWDEESFDYEINASKEEIVETTTEAPTETTTEAPTVAPTTTAATTTAATTTAPSGSSATKVAKPAKVKIKKIFKKKKSAKKLKLKLKKAKNAKGYVVAVFKSKKLAKKAKKALVKKTVKKITVTLKSKKLKNKKTLFVRARGFNTDGKTKVFGAWSAIKKVKAK